MHALAEESGAELGRRYGEAVTELLRPTTLADAVNGLNGSDLSGVVRWLASLPNVVLYALQRAESEGVLDADDPTRTVRDFAEETAYEDVIEVLVDRVTRPDVIEPVSAHVGLDRGAVPREELVRRMRQQGLDIREETFEDWLEELLRQVGDDRAGVEGQREATAPAPAAAPRGVTPGLGTVPDDRRPVAARHERGFRPPILWGLDCGLSVPVQDVASPPRGDVLSVARTIAFLYVFSERQPLLAAMDALRERALATDLFNPPDFPEDVIEDPKTDDELCDLRLLSYSWNNEVDPLTVRKRADVAAAIGVRDPAATTAVNTEFARTADQLVDVLAATVMDRRKYDPAWARAVAAELSVQLAGSFETGLTGGVLVHVALWRRQFELAEKVFTSPDLRALLGVGSDPDPSPAPAIRRVLSASRFDAASLYREWQALDRVLLLARHLSTGEVVSDDEFAETAAAAVTLRALRGRLRVPAQTTLSE